MNSRIREIVTCHVGPHAPLIAELEAYHERAMAEAADGALMGRAMLDRALGRDATLTDIGIGPRAVYVTHGVVSVSCGEKDEAFAAALRKALSLDATCDDLPSYKMSPERPGQERGDESHNDIMRAAAFGRDASLDVRPGARSPGDAVSDYVASMVDDLRARRDKLTDVGRRVDERNAAAMRAERTEWKLDDIIERNVMRQRIYAFLVERGEDGATDEEMQGWLDMNPSTQRPRRIELVTSGQVYDSGLTRKTLSGRSATVWRAKT